MTTSSVRPVAPKLVLVADTMHERGWAHLGRHAVVEQMARRPDGSPDIAQLARAHAVIVQTQRLDRELLEHCTRLEAIGKHGVGVDNIDTDYATSRGIPVTYTPGASSRGVAEHAVAIMLAQVHKVLMFHAAVVSGDFAIRDRVRVRDVSGGVIGLVGLGHVGSHVARICTQGLGMRALAYDPYVEDIADTNVTLVDALDELLVACDVLSLHVPSTPQTRGLIGARELALLKPGAVLVNVARGDIIDQSALEDALASGRLGGAALDVFDPEPPDPQAQLLTMQGSATLTPHIGGLSEGSVTAIAVDLADRIKRILGGEQIREVVNPKAWENRSRRPVHTQQHLPAAQEVEP